MGEMDHLELLYSSTEYLPHAHDSGSGQGDIISEFPIDSDTSTDWEFSFPELESGKVGDQMGEGEKNVAETLAVTPAVMGGKL